MTATTTSTYDVALIGGGIMSATLGSLLHQLEPDWKITIFEKLGDVALETVVMIGGSGHVRGSVVARAVRVSGRVEGNVTASERIEVLSTGVIDGDLSAPKIAVAEGAEIRGRVEMRAKPAAPAKATPSAGAKA